jgi:hypothetical protein
MMRWDGFGRSVVFAAVAALATGAWLVLTTATLGGRRALAVWLVALTATYIAGLVRDRARGITVAVGAFVTGCGLLLVAPGLRELVVGLALVLAVARSVFLHQRRPARAVVVEGVLLVAGLLFAAHVGGPSLHGVVAGVWAFLLVQSCFFLVPGTAERSAFDGVADPFESAHARALALLDGEP